MNAKRLLGAYGLWLAGVLSAAAAAYLLHRSRVIGYELQDELQAEPADDGWNIV